AGDGRAGRRPRSRARRREGARRDRQPRAVGRVPGARLRSRSLHVHVHDRRPHRGRGGEACVTDEALHRFKLEAIDPVTECIATRVGFVVVDGDLPEMRTLIGAGPGEVETMGRDLAPDVVDRLTERFGIVFDTGDHWVRLSPWHSVDDLPYDVHSEREL